MGAEVCFQLSDAERESLRGEWLALLSAYACSAEKASAGFDALAAAYDEAGRCYHNLSHVWALLRLAADYQTALTDYNAIRWAIWFHDAVYNARSSDNEERSAAWAVQLLPEFAVPAETVTFVERLILATKSHHAAELNADARLFLDLDLAILGATETTYARYAAAIRREYKWVPKILYRRGRRKVLAGFLERSAIYLTPQLAGRFEAQARRNLQLELAELSR
ncbi:MAG: hypothetical protein JNJ50_15850 [Acidobacteria bacterium]|nr:hypothetical protein [Acidobacteriota bacterium]